MKMKKEVQSSIFKVFGWPDSSWLRAYKMVNEELIANDTRTKTAQKTLCKAINTVIDKDIEIAVDRIKSSEFQIAHAFTNELLELAKMKRETCEPESPAPERRRDFDVRLVPKSAEKIPVAEMRKIFPPARAAKLTKKEEKAIEEFLRGEAPESVKEAVTEAVETIEEEPVTVTAKAPPIKEKPKVSYKMRLAMDEATKQLRIATDKYMQFLDTLQEVEKPDTPENFAQFIALEREAMLKLAEVLNNYNEIHKAGYELPKGNMARGKENESFAKRVKKSTEALAGVSPPEAPIITIANVTEDHDLRDIVLESVLRTLAKPEESKE